MLTGWKTLIVNSAGLISGMLAIKGIIVPPELISEAGGGVLAAWSIVNIVLRTRTKTPVGG